MMELSLRKSGESAHTLQILQTEKHKRGQAGKYYPGGRNITILLVSQTLQILQALQTETGKHMSGQNGQILLPSVKSGRRAQNCSFSNNQAKETAD